MIWFNNYRSICNCVDLDFTGSAFLRSQYDPSINFPLSDFINIHETLQSQNPSKTNATIHKHNVYKNTEQLDQIYAFGKYNIAFVLN